MLYYSTIEPHTLQLLKNLQNLDFLKDYVLVGGTSLALQIGHRISIDLDLFTSEDIDVSLILEQIIEFGDIKIINQGPKILNLFIDEIKVDFVSYRYGFQEPPQLLDGLKLASISDIAAMKLAAIAGRGSRKDFIDLYFILEEYSLPEIFAFYEAKYPEGSNFMVYKSLLYFEDAEIQPMPKMLKNVNWNTIKNKIISEVKTHFP